MCLKKLDSSITVTGVGYKVGKVYRHTHIDQRLFITAPRGEPIVFGWGVRNNSRDRVEAENGDTYQSGFHVYLNREDAVQACTRLWGHSVVRVTFPVKEVVTGRECLPGNPECPVAVCQEIKIEDEIFYTV